MKCKHCNGTGATNWYVNREHLTCPYCGGTGEVEGNMTNDEWRKTCSAEEFAEWISNLVYACMRCGMSNSKAYCHTTMCIQDKEDALRWLKQPHTNFVRSGKWYG